jgi:hypothetical protein
MPLTTAPTVELWMRRLPAGEGEEHDELRRRLARLDRRGVVETVRVRTWPHEVVVDESLSARDRAIVDRVRAFERWAEREGVGLPAFERTTVGVGRMGPGRTALRLPQTALAVWRDGSLQWVAPCVRGGARRSPLDWIADAVEGAAPGCSRGPRLVA